MCCKRLFVIAAFESRQQEKSESAAKRNNNNIFYSISLLKNSTIINTPTPKGQSNRHSRSFNA
jgi:hypothetical protein